MTTINHKQSRYEIDNFDISVECKDWGMYSYERPAYHLWDTIGRALFQQGWTKQEIRLLLQSKYIRWALDGDLGDALTALGEAYARDMSRYRAEVQQWAKEESEVQL